MCEAETMTDLTDELEHLEAVNGALLSACQHALKVLDPGEDHPSCLVTHLQSAIAKADGNAAE